MSLVPRRSKRAVSQGADKPVNGALESPAPALEPAANGAVPVEPIATASPAAGASPPSQAASSALDDPAASAFEHPPAAPTTTITTSSAAEPEVRTNGHAVLPEEHSLDLAESPPASPRAESPPAGALAVPGLRLPPDPGLYAVLRLDPSASDAEIQTTYRRLAARLLGSGSNDIQALKQLNVAYEVLGNPVRRAEYDRLRLTPLKSVATPAPTRPGAKTAAPVKRRRRPRQAVQPRYAGLGDVVVVLMVVGLAVLAGVLIIPRLSINLSALNVVQSVLPLSNTSSRRATEPTITPSAATAVPTATPQPGVAASFLGSTVSVSNPTPARGSTETVVVRLRRDGKPAANIDVWSTVKYRTTEERWPAAGAVRTDASGAASIAFNVGSATPDYPVTVNVVAQVNDQQLTWSTTFTPH